MRIAFTVIVLIFFATIAHAQISLSGKVVDAATGKPVDYATIVLSDQATGRIVDGATADSGGTFFIRNIPAGIYQIAASFLGYDTYTIDSLTLVKSHPQAVLPLIHLSAGSHSLKAVTVTGAAPVVENKIDKIVYNTVNDLTSQGGVALDVLKKLPQVSVDADGNVELQGNSNIRFLINGKPSGILGNSLTDALSSIPASQIQSIEVITSPGARYDAQGTGGIINIILKENKMKGVNGSISLSAGTRMENASVNLSAKRGRFGMNAFFSSNATLKARLPASQDRTSYNTADQTNTRLLQDGYSNMSRNGYQTGIGFDWDFSRADAVTGSFQYNDFSNQRDGITNQLQTITDSRNNVLSDTGSVRNSGSSMSTHSFDWSLHYKHKFRREGEELDIHYNSSFGRPVLQYNQTQSYSSAASPYTGSSSYNPGTDDQTNISADYAYPITKRSLLEAGAKSSFNHITSLTDVAVLSTANGQYLYDTLQSYALQYKMHIYAGYVSASFPLFTFLDVKAGFRAEHTDISIDYDHTYIPSYNTYVPSVSFSHKFNDKQFVKLAYTHRIERPVYEDLNPFLNRSDPYNLTTGNPLLQPEVGDNFEIGYNHSFKNGANIYVALVERINSNDIKTYTSFYPTYKAGDSVYTNVSVATRVNIGMEYNTGLVITGSAPIAGKLNIRGNLMLFDRYIINSLDTANRYTGGFNWRLNMNLSYELPRNLITEAFGNYRSALNNVQGKNPQFLTYTFALRKQFWNKNASVGFTATNFFSNFVRQVTTINAGTYNSYSVRDIPMRSLGVTFSYKFGKLDFKDKKADNNFMYGPADN